MKTGLCLSWMFGIALIWAIAACQVFHTIPDLNRRINAYFPFDGNSIDSVNGFTGTIIGAEVYTTGVNGQPRSSFHFASNEIINVPGCLVQLNENYTITFWIYFDSLNQIDRMEYPVTNRINQNFHEAGGMDFNFHYDTLHIEFFKLKPLGILDQFISDKIIRLNSWHLIVYKRKNHLTFLYIDGQLINTYPVGPHHYDDSNYWSFGAIQNARQIFRGIRGNLDQVRFYRRSLTTSEINYLYEKKL